MDGLIPIGSSKKSDGGGDFDDFDDDFDMLLGGGGNESSSKKKKSKSKEKKSKKKKKDDSSKSSKKKSSGEGGASKKQLDAELAKALGIDPDDLDKDEEDEEATTATSRTASVTNFNSEDISFGDDDDDVLDSLLGFSAPKTPKPSATTNEEKTISTATTNAASIKSEAASNEEESSSYISSLLSTPRSERTGRRRRGRRVTDDEKPTVARKTTENVIVFDDDDDEQVVKPFKADEVVVRKTIPKKTITLSESPSPPRNKSESSPTFRRTGSVREPSTEVKSEVPQPSSTSVKKDNSFKATVDAINAQHEADVEEIKSTYEKQISTATTKSTETIKNLEQQLSELSENLSRVSHERDDAIQLSEKNLAELTRSYEEKLQHQDQEATKKLKSIALDHESTVQQLRRNYELELGALQTTINDNENSSKDELKSIVTDVRRAAGSIKALEKQICIQQVNSDSKKLYEEEARVKILVDMEEACKGYTLRAQDECGRLQGLLSVMENTMASMRGQGVEEKERLRAEHERLKDMATTFNAETNAVRHSLQIERQALSERTVAFENEKRVVEIRLAKKQEALDAEKRALDSERIAFDLLVQEQKTTASVDAERLRELELRIQRQQDKVRHETEVFNERRRTYMNEIRDHEARTREIEEQGEKIEAEKRRLTAMANEMQEMSIKLSEKEAKAVQESNGAYLALEEAKAISKRFASDTSTLNALKQQVREEQARVESARLQLAKERSSFLYERKESQRFIGVNASRDQQEIKMHLQHQATVLSSDSMYNHQGHNLAAAVGSIKPVVSMMDPTGLKKDFRNTLESWWETDRFNTPEMLRPALPVTSQPAKSTTSFRLQPKKAYSIKL